MDTARVIWLFVIIVGAQAAVWVPIILRMRWQRERLSEEVRRAGETMVLGPERADYQGWHRRFGYAQTMGILALTDRSLLFKRPIGTDIRIPFGEITQVSDTASLGRLHHTTRNYLVLTLTDGSEAVFIVSHHARWLDALRTRLAQTV